MNTVAVILWATDPAHLALYLVVMALVWLVVTNLGLPEGVVTITRFTLVIAAAILALYFIKSLL